MNSNWLAAEAKMTRASPLAAMASHIFAAAASAARLPIFSFVSAIDIFTSLFSNQFQGVVASDRVKFRRGETNALGSGDMNGPSRKNPRIALSHSA